MSSADLGQFSSSSSLGGIFALHADFHDGHWELGSFAKLNSGVMSEDCAFSPRKCKDCPNICPREPSNVPTPMGSRFGVRARNFAAQDEETCSPSEALRTRRQPQRHPQLEPKRKNTHVLAVSSHVKDPQDDKIIPQPSTKVRLIACLASLR